MNAPLEAKANPKIVAYETMKSVNIQITISNYLPAPDFQMMDALKGQVFYLKNYSTKSKFQQTSKDIIGAKNGGTKRGMRTCKVVLFYQKSIYLYEIRYSSFSNYLFVH